MTEGQPLLMRVDMSGLCSTAQEIRRRIRGSVLISRLEMGEWAYRFHRRTSDHPDALSTVPVSLRPDLNRHDVFVYGSWGTPWQGSDPNATHITNHA